jgi:hypothetical protein
MQYFYSGNLFIEHETDLSGYTCYYHDDPGPWRAGTKKNFQPGSIKNTCAKNAMNSLHLISATIFSR